MDEREKTKAEEQLDSLRVAIDCLCDIGNREPGELSAVNIRLLRAMTPLRQLEGLLVHTVEREAIERHVRSSVSTPGMSATGC